MGEPRYCDVVMKGGITSGVIYPLAVARLADSYRFRNVGGTSAGAIAAAAAAAAEHGRRGDQGTGIDGLRALPEWLGNNLSSLFIPSAGTTPLFDVVMASTRGAGIGEKSRNIAQAALGAFFLPATVGMIPGLALVLASIFGGGDPALEAAGIVSGALIAALGAVTAVAIAAYARLTREVPQNYLGLCSGYRQDESLEPAPLTTWLARELDRLAGVENRSKPLTFGDLEGADPDAESAIKLQMITSCLTQGRPYRLPFPAEESHQFWFSEREFRDLFPEKVVDWMIESSRASESGTAYPGLLPLPEPADMPVAVGARMSLSFPLLISAIPLWAIDRARKDVHGDPSPERVWFSDGGITSNFPIHMFDSPVPRWPTFAINLRKFGRDWPEDPSDPSASVNMVSRNGEGRAAHWTPWPDTGLGAVKGLMRAVSGISRTWMDEAQSRIPGYRDRVVHIAHNEAEGGMNLDMDADVVRRLADRGERAADLLIDHFAVPPREGLEVTWDNQRWVRYRSFMAALEVALTRFERGCTEHHPEDRSIRQLNERRRNEQPGSYEWTEKQRELALSATATLMELADTFDADATLTRDAPAPTPELRARPPI
jgi:predicted acylesterase/phospholipase RssA